MTLEVKMTRLSSARIRIAGALVLGALALSTSVHAAFPRLIMFSGGPLKSPLVMTDWYAVAAFMQSLPAPGPIQESVLSGRPFMQVTLFWGPSWKAYMDEGRPISILKPDQGNAHGRFYPATTSSPAVFLHTDAPNLFDTPVAVPTGVSAFSSGYFLDANSIRLLERAGVPVLTGSR